MESITRKLPLFKNNQSQHICSYSKAKSFENSMNNAILTGNK